MQPKPILKFKLKPSNKAGLLTLLIISIRMTKEPTNNDIGLMTITGFQQQDLYSYTFVGNGHALHHLIEYFLSKSELASMQDLLFLSIDIMENLNLLKIGQLITFTILTLLNLLKIRPTLLNKSTLKLLLLMEAQQDNG